MGATDMTSAPHSATLPISAEPNSAGPPADEVRLRLKPRHANGPAARGYVDGAWWPGSRDLAKEVPALVEALAATLGRIERMSYNLMAWPATVRVLRLDGGPVHLAGYRGQHPDTVDVLARDHRITLLVVPPDAPAEAAARALVDAADPDNTASPTDLLVTAGVRPGSPTAVGV
jgi:hypothetical protein